MDTLPDAQSDMATTVWDSLSIPNNAEFEDSLQATTIECRRTVEDRRKPSTTHPSSQAPDKPDEPAAHPQKLCLAFQGACGGVGVTTLAIETAHVLSRSGRGKVCLVDLDFETGALAPYLDVSIQPQNEDFRGDPTRLDAQFIQARLHMHEAGFSVFASSPDMHGGAAVEPACVLAALDTLAEMFDVIILDVPRLGSPWTQAALLAADKVCLVTDLTIPALHLCRQRLQAIEQSGVECVEVVLSKYERRSFRASLRAGDAERALGREIFGVIAADAYSATDALNCAVPIGMAARDSRLVKDIGTIVRALSPHYAERRSAARRKG